MYEAFSPAGIAVAYTWPSTSAPPFVSANVCSASIEGYRYRSMPACVSVLSLLALLRERVECEHRGIQVQIDACVCVSVLSLLALLPCGVRAQRDKRYRSMPVCVSVLSLLALLVQKYKCCRSSPRTCQFTCFTSTKVQMLPFVCANVCIASIEKGTGTDPRMRTHM